MIARRGLIVGASVLPFVRSAFAQDAYKAPASEHALNLVNLLELEQQASSVLTPGAFGYIAGGAGDEWTLHENRRAFDDTQIIPRRLAGFGLPDLSTTVLGAKMALPVIISPMAGQGLVHVSAEAGTAKGAGLAGAVFSAPTMSNVTLEDIARATQGPKWFQLYYAKDPGLNRAWIKRIEAAGYGAIIFTVDLEFPGNREADRRNNFSFPTSLPFANLDGPARDGGFGGLRDVVKGNLSWDDLSFLRKESKLPIIVKGILSPADAKLCVERGASAVQVSNHGGRQLDGVQAAIRALPAIVDAVGSQVPIIMDGGIRRGIDVFKALALGASAVAIGRPALYGLALGGAAGVKSVLDKLKAELMLAMKLSGCASIAGITRAHVT
ncbi:MAG: alpha-hydroxy-acid oxidizing protein [Rhodospirillaceae bacterium]|nr:alpha-hydroxy-acid oxidizing protein [Rhodospirillaceae bacterium]